MKNPIRIKKEKVFILYEFDKFKKDFRYVKEYYNKREIIEDDLIKLSNPYSINQYLSKNIEKITKLLNDKYILIVEEL